MASKPGFLQLYNYETSQPEAVAETELERAVLSGKYGLPKDKLINVISPDGKPGTINPGEAQQAFEAGFKYEPVEARERRLQIKEAEQQPLRAAAEAAARGVTLGVSDPLLKAAGANMEEVRARKEAFPIASEVLEIGASALPFLATGGIGATARGAAAAGSALAAKQGAKKISAELLKDAAQNRAKALSQAAGKRALKPAQQRLLTEADKRLVAQGGKELKRVAKQDLATQKNFEKVAKKVLDDPKYAAIKEKIGQNLKARAAGSAVEGAFFGAGELLSENALGNAELNAETLLANIGAGAVLGGAVGTAFGGIQALTPLATKAVSRTGKAASRYTDPEQAGLELAGLTAARASGVKQKNSRLAKENLEFLKEELPQEKLSGYGATKFSIKELYERKNLEAGESIARTLSKVDDAVKRENMTLIRESFYQPIISKVDDYIAQYVDSPGFKPLVKQLRKIQKDYIKLRDKPGNVNVKELQKFRQHADKLAGWSRRQGDPSDLQTMMRDIRGIFRKQIDGVADFVAAQNPAQYAGLGDDLRRANRNFFVTASLKDAAAKKADMDQVMSFRDFVLGGVGYGAGGEIGLAIAGAKRLLESDMRRKAVILRSIEQGQRKFDSQLTKSLSNYFKKPTAAIRPITTKALVTSAITRDPDTGKKATSREQGYQNTVKLLNKMESNPEFATKRITGAAARVAQAAPETAQAAQATMVRAATFLSQKVPKKAAQSGVVDILRKDAPVPSSVELAKFENYLQIIDDPLTALDQLESGTLTRESVEALQAVYPTMYAELQRRTLARIAEDPDALSYSKKVQLGILLDVPTDTSLLPQNVIALQENFISEEPEQQGAVNSTVGGIKGIEKAGREMTDTQRIQSQEL